MAPSLFFKGRRAARQKRKYMTRVLDTSAFSRSEARDWQYDCRIYHPCTEELNVGLSETPTSLRNLGPFLHTRIDASRIDAKRRR